MIVNDVKVEQAIAACELQEILPYSTLYYRVRLARKKGTYDSVIKAKAEEAIRMNMKVGLVINIEESEDASQTSTNISPVTMKSLLSSPSNATSTSASTATSSAEGRRNRKSSRQASVAKLMLTIAGATRQHSRRQLLSWHHAQMSQFTVFVSD